MRFPDVGPARRLGRPGKRGFVRRGRGPGARRLLDAAEAAVTPGGRLRLRLGRVGLATAVVAAGCAASGAEPAIRVVLHVAHAVGVSPAGTVVRGDHLGVVCFAVDPPATVAAVAAPALVDELRAALGTAGAPATTAPRSLPLPAAVDAAVSDTPCDVVLFDDADGDGGWSRGEGYVTAWSGGRGSVRIVHRTGGDGGWRLIEGGSPPVERPLPAGRTVAVDPVVEAIEAR